MIKLLQTDLSDDVPYPDVENPTSDALQDVYTLGGVSLAGKFPPQTLVYKVCERPFGLVDYFSVGLLAVVSEKLKSVLEGANAEAEYFPVTVLYRRVPTPLQYFVMNPLVRLKAVDLEHSVVEIDEDIGDCLDIDKLVIDETKFQGIQMAMIHEIGYIGMQEELAALVKAAGCIGCDFVDPITVRR